MAMWKRVIPETPRDGKHYILDRKSSSKKQAVKFEWDNISSI